MPTRTQRYIKRAFARKRRGRRQVVGAASKSDKLTKKERRRFQRLLARADPATVIEYFDRKFGIPDDEVLPLRSYASRPLSADDERILENLSRRSAERKNRPGEL